MNESAISVREVAYTYGSHRALGGVSFEVAAGELFAILGPNGGGKTTLFRLLSTLIPLQSGAISVFGADLAREADRARTLLGVVFQAPSLDRKLTVLENLRHQGHLYGLSGSALAQRCDELLHRFGIADRRSQTVEKLSGGLRRRVELAKGLLHRPRVLLLDEPSTGLDPAARSDLWHALSLARREDGTTIVLTTHLLAEADDADRLMILSRGEIVALDTPAALRSTIGGESISIQCADPADAQQLANEIASRFQTNARLVEGLVRIEQAAGERLLGPIIEAFSARIESITQSKPSLEDVFIARTGHRFWQSEEVEGAA